MTIPFVDLKAQYSPLAQELGEALRKVMESTRFILGPEVESFEKEFADFCTCRNGIGVASGTDALLLALKAAGVGPGDEVITAANTYIATAFAISHAGARTVLVDIDEETYNIDPSLIERAITSKTKAIIPVHLYGQTADMDPAARIAEERGLPVIEDACQAHGAEYRGRKAGSLGTAGCFSFYPGKNLGAYGDGGMVVTDDEEIADAVRMLRNLGQKVKHHHLVPAYNSRLDTLQAAILRVKLGHLREWNEARRRCAKLYNRLLPTEHCATPVEASWARHVYHLYVIRVKERDELIRFLQERGIATGIHYPMPIHLQEAYRELGYARGDFAVAERCAEEILSLPMYPELREEEIERVCDGIRQFFSR